MTQHTTATYANTSVQGNCTGDATGANYGNWCSPVYNRAWGLWVCSYCGAILYRG